MTVMSDYTKFVPILSERCVCDQFSIRHESHIREAPP